MANRVATFDAPAFAKKIRVTLSGDPGESAYMKATIGRKSLEVVAGGEANTDILKTLLQSMATAWNGTAQPEFAEATAEVDELEDGSAHLDIEADTPGVPFDVAFTTPYPVIDVDTYQQGIAAQNEIQSFWFVTQGTAGTYTIKWDFGSGLETSSSIAFNGDAAAVQAALISGMSSVGIGDVAVSGLGTVASPFVVELQGSLAGTLVDSMIIDTSSLVGGGVVTIVTTQEGGIAGPASQILLDNFTGSDGTALTSHSADTAQGWTNVTGTTPTIQSNKLSNSSAAAMLCIVSSAVGADLIVDCDLVISSGGSLGIVFRYADSSNYLRCRFSVSGALAIERVLAGVETALGSSSVFPHTLGTPYHVTLTISGTSIRAEDSAGNVVVVSSSFNVSNTGFGVFSTPGATGTWEALDVYGATSTNEIQTVSLNGTGGTFTLTKPGGGTSTALSAGSTTAQIKTAVEAVYGGTATVTGSGISADPWVISMGGALAGTAQPQMIGDGSLLSGVLEATVDSVQVGSVDLPEIWDVVINDATGGTFAFTFLQFRTAEIAFGANAATVEAALELLPTLPACTVSGAGTTGSPYRITVAGDLVGTPVSQLIAHSELLTGLASITVTVETLQESRGPLHADDPLNWVNPATGLSGLPETGDDVFLQFGDSDRCFKYGLDQFSVKLNSLNIYASFADDAEIGLPPWNDNGYWEYRELYWHVGLQGAKMITIGKGAGSGSGRINIDTEDDEAHITVLRTSGPSDGSLRSVQWRGTDAASTIEVVEGQVAVAPYAAESAVLAKLTQRSGSVLLGAGVTVGAGSGVVIDKTGGDLEMDAATIDGLVSIAG